MLLKQEVIHVRDLRKDYLLYERDTGIRAALYGLVHHCWRRVSAVHNLSFDIRPGEIVGLLGPNGAGKTTSLKLLAGLLSPTAGELCVLGHAPWRREKAFLRQITLVMGQRSRLWWDLPARDSFELHRVIYDIAQTQYCQMLHTLTDLLELGPLLSKPVRTLSLGERMKCEFALAFLHRPQVLFLDEPTIGLDVPMQRRIWTFLKEYNRRFEATVILTSHYMADVEALCHRVLIMHTGRLLFDGELTQLVQAISPHKIVTLALDQYTGDVAAYGEVIASTEGQVLLRIPSSATSHVTQRLLMELPVTDLSIEDPPIEDVIEQVFSGEGL
jgi:ABC-2 type transport system ATP-binding protein